MVDISLARAALEEDRNCEQLLAFLNGGEQARRRALAYVPLTVKIFVVTLARGREVRIDVESITFDADLAIDQRATARVIGQAEGDFRFCHQLVLSRVSLSMQFKVQCSKLKMSQPFQSFQKFQLSPEPL